MHYIYLFFEPRTSETGVLSNTVLKTIQKTNHRMKIGLHYEYTGHKDYVISLYSFWFLVGQKKTSSHQK